MPNDLGDTMQLFCPRCGQQQVSPETKFCSRCGFQLGLVNELILNGGYLPQLEQLRKRPWLSRTNGIVFSVMWFIFFTLLLTSLIGIAGGEDSVAVAAVIGIFGSMMLLLASLVFLRNPPRSLPISYLAMGPQMDTTAKQGALPAEQSIPAGVYDAPKGNWRAPATGEVRFPGSVTDDTTKLLKKEE